MAGYIVIKTIKGRRYVYRQRTWREGKRVRTETLYVGPADRGGTRSGGALYIPKRPKTALRKSMDLAKANLAPRWEPDIEKLWKEDQPRREREEHARQELLDRLHASYGLKLGSPNPVPIEKPAVDMLSIMQTAGADAKDKNENGGTPDNSSSGASTGTSD